MDRKFQIFVSSTRNDLVKVRDAAMRAILEIGHIPVGMEMFSAADDDSWSLIKKQIDLTDFYIVIVAHRYGSTALDGISYTEKEYDYACSKGIPVFGFLIEDSASWPHDQKDSEPGLQQALMRFKEKIKTKQVAFWNDAGTLQARVLATLAKQVVVHDRPGWIRGTSVPSAAVADEISRLSRENAELRHRLESSAVPDLAIELIGAQFALFTSGAVFDDESTAYVDGTFSVHPRNTISASFILDRLLVQVASGDSVMQLKGKNIVAAEGGASNHEVQLTISGAGVFRLESNSLIQPGKEFEAADELFCRWEFRPVGYDIAYIVETKLGNRFKENRLYKWSIGLVN